MDHALESTRFAAYDDKTGKPITPTTVLVGKAHIGVGFDLKRLAPSHCYRPPS